MVEVREQCASVKLCFLLVIMATETVVVSNSSQGCLHKWDANLRIVLKRKRVVTCCLKTNFVNHPNGWNYHEYSRAHLGRPLGINQRTYWFVWCVLDFLPMNFKWETVNEISCNKICVQLSYRSQAVTNEFVTNRKNSWKLIQIFLHRWSLVMRVGATTAMQKPISSITNIKMSSWKTLISSGMVFGYTQELGLCLPKL